MTSARTKNYRLNDRFRASSSPKRETATAAKPPKTLSADTKARFSAMFETLNNLY